MDIKNQIEYYDNLWSQRLPLNSLQLRRAVKVLSYFINIKRILKNPRVLDLGCGDGRFTGFIGEYCEVDGIELSEAAIKEAKKQYPHVNFFQGNALTYPFKDNFYDLVISQEVIEHIEDQKLYLNVCHNVLKRGGYLIMTTPNKTVFDHMKGGNWSHQPVEKLLNPKSFKLLIASKFRIESYDTVIMNFGNLGYFKFINHRYIRGGFKYLGLNWLRDFVLSKLGFGLHQCVLAKKL